MWEEIKAFFVNAGFNILIGIAILIAGLIVARILKVVLKKFLIKAKKDEAIVSFITSLIDVIVKIIIFISAFATMGINTASLVAFIGAGGVAIGLALKDSLGNLASGLLIIYNKPFKKGDYVRMASEEGIVSNINLFNTSLTTYDNKTIVIPNSSAVQSPLVNCDLMGKRRVDVSVSVKKDVDVDKIKSVLMEIASGHDLVVDRDKSNIYMTEIGLSYVKFDIRVFANAEDYWTVHTYLTETAFLKLREENMLATNEQVDIHMSDNK